MATITKKTTTKKVVTKKTTAKKRTLAGAKKINATDKRIDELRKAGYIVIDPREGMKLLGITNAEAKKGREKSIKPFNLYKFLENTKKTNRIKK